MSTLLRCLESRCAALRQEIEAMENLLNAARANRDAFLVLIASTRAEARIIIRGSEKSGRKRWDDLMASSYAKARGFGYREPQAVWRRLIDLNVLGGEER